MVIGVQGDHLLSRLHEMREHKNLETYTPRQANSSRLGVVNFENCDEKAIADFADESCVDAVNHAQARGPEPPTSHNRRAADWREGIGLYRALTQPEGKVGHRKDKTPMQESYCVGAPRFELGTSRTRTVRSTGLSHAPNDPVVLGAGRIIHAGYILCKRGRMEG